MDRNPATRNPAARIEEEARARTDEDAAARKSRDDELAERQRATEEQRPAQQADPYAAMTEQTQKLDAERQDREKQDRERHERDDRAKHSHEREQKKTGDERVGHKAEEQSQPVAVADLSRKNAAAEIDVFELGKKTGADRDVANATDERVARGEAEERLRKREQNRPIAVADLFGKDALAKEIDMYSLRGASRDEALDSLRGRVDEIQAKQPDLYRQLEREGHLQPPERRSRDEVVADLLQRADVKKNQPELYAQLQREGQHDGSRSGKSELPDLQRQPPSELELRITAALARSNQERNRARDDDDRGGPTHSR